MHVRKKIREEKADFSLASNLNVSTLSFVNDANRRLDYFIHISFSEHIIFRVVADFYKDSVHAKAHSNRNPDFNSIKRDNA